jgi:MFS superfamily sulfate permease-like transporter
MTPASDAVPAPQLSRTQSISKDLIAGTVVFLVALPLCLGIAHASGAPVIAGIISGIIGGIVVGLLSGSHISVSGPAAGLAAIVLSQIQVLGSYQAFLLAVAISGILQIGLGALRAGVLANYFPTNVIRGLLAAIGVILILKQLPHLVGHDADYEGEMAFAQNDGKNTFSEIAEALRAFLPGAALVGLSCIALLFVWEKSRLKKSLFPAPLAAVLLGVAISELLRVSGSSWTIEQSHLVEVPVVGVNGQGWGTIFSMPDWSQWNNPKIYTAAITLAIVASLETLLNLEATDKLDPQKRVSPPNRELLAQGVGNVAAGLIGGMPMTSVIVRSSVNAGAGARSRLSCITHGVLLTVCVFFIPTLLNHIPLAALAAILVATGFKLASPKLFVQMAKGGRSQFIPFAITVLAIVFTDLLMGVIIGLVVSLMFVLNSNLRRGMNIIKEEHVGGIVNRVELANQVSFLNRAALMRTLSNFGRGEQVVIDARTTDYIDPDIYGLIQTFRDETGPARGVIVSLIGFKNHYQLADHVQYVDVTTREVQDKLTPARVLQVLKEGNDRFASGRRLQRDLIRQVDATSYGQHPMAVVLSCIDSRSPAEILFDLGLGDIFSVRLAGNVLSRKVLGSMEFACKVAGAKLILVLGHTSCGAVKATCDIVGKNLDTVQATGLTNLPYLVEPISKAVRMETTTTQDRVGSNYEFVDRVAAIHVRNVMLAIRQESPTLRDMIDAGQIQVAGAMYNVKSGQVEFMSAVDANRAVVADTVAT